MSELKTGCHWLIGQLVCLPGCACSFGFGRFSVTKNHIIASFCFLQLVPSRNSLKILKRGANIFYKRRMRRRREGYKKVLQPVTRVALIIVARLLISKRQREKQMCLVGVLSVLCRVFLLSSMAPS